MVKFDNVIFEYIRRDEDGNVESINKALDEIKVHINPGEFIVILGANGSGKSTFARHINGLLTPTEGTVYTDGLDTKDDENTLEIRKAAGMVFQNPDNQIVASVVEEDVAFGLENMGVPSKEIRKRVHEALEKVGIAKYHDKSPNKLSGGQKQRVAIAGVLAMKNKCIILDEPTAMLDPLGRKEVLKTIHDLNKNENITVILITHYMQEAVDADKIIVMNSGKCVMSGTPRQVFAHVDELKKYKLEVPQVTELAYRLRKAGLNMPACVLTEDEFVAAIDAL